MARPRKSDEERLVPAKTTLVPVVFDHFDQLARDRHVPLATVLRETLDESFRELKTKLS